MRGETRTLLGPPAGSPLRSHVLEGKVRHRRLRPVDYALEHDVWYLALDVDELDEADGRLRLFGRNRPRPVTFRDGDHWPSPADDIRSTVRDHLRAEGIDPSGWRITLVAYPRVLGHVFNPASFYLCRDAGGVLRTVIVEVHNTHLERHLYTLHARDDHVAGGDPGDAGRGGPFTASMEKAFYVSPFLDITGSYAVRVRDDARRLRIAIDQRQDDMPMLATSLVLERRRLTDRTLLRMLVRHPFVTVKTVVAIHWHAWHLWRRGIRFRRHSLAVR